MDILRRLSSLGIVVAIATGRSISAVMQYVNLLALPQPFLPLVCFNGSYVMNLVTDHSQMHIRTEVIHAAPMEAVSALKLIDFSHSNGYGMQVCICRF